MFERTPCDGNYYYFFAIVLHKYNIHISILSFYLKVVRSNDEIQKTKQKQTKKVNIQKQKTKYKYSKQTHTHIFSFFFCLAR